MAKNRNILFIALAIVLSLALFAVWKWQSPKSASQGEYQSSDWQTTYEAQSKSPRGLFLFFRLLKLKNKVPKLVSLSSRDKWDSIANLKETALYIAIGDTIGFTNSEWEKMQAKIEQGSTFFMASSCQTENILDFLQIKEHTSFAYERKVRVKFDNNRQKIDFYAVFNLDTIYAEWQGITRLENTYTHKETMRFKGMTAMYETSIGKGKFIHLTLPQTLTNYALKSKNAFAYARFIATQFPSKTKVYVLDFTQLHNTIEEQEDEFNFENEKTLLKFILENRILLNTMMLVFSTIILFLMFRTRRRKNLIPVLPPQTNTTLAFVESVASIFLKQQIPSSILAIQKKNFFDTVLRYYYIDMHRKADEESIRLLAEKTGYDLKRLTKLIQDLNTRHVSVDNEFVSHTAKMQLEFYTHCGIHQPAQEQVKSSIELRKNTWITVFVFMLGIVFFFNGLIQLAKSNPIGSIFWMMGWILLLFGFTRILRSHFSIHKGKIEVYNAFGFKQKISNNFDFQVYFDDKNIIVEYDGKKKFIPKLDTSRIDRSRLERFIHLKDEYDNR